MIVHVATYLESIGGSIDKDHYLRKLPMRPGYAVLCPKPKYDKKKKKQMAQSEQATWFAEMMAKAKAIYNNPELRAQYAEEHKKAWEAYKKKDPDGVQRKPGVPALLWEYIRHRVAEEMKGQD